LNEIERAILEGCCADPHAYLGAHEAPGGAVIRTFQPSAVGASLVFSDGSRKAMDARGDGFFEAFIAGGELPLAYRLSCHHPGGGWESGDPYRFWPSISPDALDRFSAGVHERLWEVLGANVRTVDHEEGVAFAVWAPNARAVHLLGEFNGWDRRTHPMRSMGSSGVWEIFMPGVRAGESYKFAVHGADGRWREKSDPLGRWFEMRPASATIVERSTFQWTDDAWMRSRKGHDHYRSPMSIYEVHAGSWRRHTDGRWLSYRELADELVPYLVEMGYTHVEFLPLSEHPYDGSWGYQVTGFFAATSRHGNPDDLRYLVNALHRAGIGVFVDWVPAHFATDEYGLVSFDGTALYEHEDWRRRVQPDWGTFAFNYGRTEVRNFLIASAMYWIKEFHIDGLRVDAVSSMVYLDYSREHGEWAPNMFGGREHIEAVDFLRRFNETVYADGDGAITIAEESTAWPAVSRPTYDGGLGFGFKWNMGWMHDTLVYMSRDPVYRRHHQGMLTFSMVYFYTENFILSLSHDEVVHGKASLLHKMPGDEWQQFANLRLLFAYQFLAPGKKLSFMGSELGQRSEWSHQGSVEWHALDYGPHRQLHRLSAELNRFYRAHPPLYMLDYETRGFEWLDFGDDANSVIVFARSSGAPNQDLVCILNFTPVVRHDYRVPVPHGGRYRETLNTDHPDWGGSGVLNEGLLVAEAHAHAGQEHSVRLTLPPLAALVLERVME